jgi:flagellum-specific peptidoglycan hydrolase FlgJ
MLMTADQQAWIKKTVMQALAAAHVWPLMAACEAALESAYGQSLLARIDNNLFGMKQHVHAVYGTHNLPTREFLDPDGAGPEPKQWLVVDAPFVHYPDVAACFADRMATLRRLAHAYPHYSAALAASDAYVYVDEVSKTWSTDPVRARKVTAIYGEYFRAQPGTESLQPSADESTQI